MVSRSFDSSGFFEFGSMTFTLMNHFAIFLDNESEIKAQINRDDKYYEMRIEFAQQEYMVKHLEETLGNINRMGFSINAFISLKKLLMGIS